MSARFANQFRLLLIVQLITSGLFLTNIQEQCQKSCTTDLVVSDKIGSQVFHDHNISSQHCLTGSSLYLSAASSSCLNVCTSAAWQRANQTEGAIPSQDEIRNCLKGCNCTLDGYSRKLISQLRPLKPLTLAIRSYSSVTLKWSTPIWKNVSYKVYKFIVAMDTGWQLHEEANFRQDGRIELTSLHPFVTYKFKVMVLASSLTKYKLETGETSEITTQAHGAPASGPQIESIAASSPFVIFLKWTPPIFTNGRLLRYHVYVQAVSQPHLDLTTLELTPDVMSSTLRQLQPGQQYLISVSAWNSQGEGPNSTRTITTPTLDPSVIQEEPYLVLGIANRIVIRSLKDVSQSGSLTSGTVLEHSGKFAGQAEYVLKGGDVKGISLHVRRQLILATDISGRVTLVSLRDNRASFNYYSSIEDARAISVDWLTDRVYIGSGNKICSCTIDKDVKDMCVIVVQGLAGTANDVKVDPINGYLYYVINGEDQGLYRLSLGDVNHLWASSDESQTLLPPSPELIINMSDMLTHVIDLINVRLYLVNESTSVLMTSSLDGSDVGPLNENTVNSTFTHVTSMAFYNQTFIWTDKRKIFVEEFESHSHKHRHSELLIFKPPYAGLEVFHPSSQPIPVPPNSPQNVEVLFTKDSAAIKWAPPPFLPYQGSGAWINWTYELQLSMSSESNDVLGVLKEYNITGLGFTITDLELDNVYKVKVRAWSTTGCGPWSSDFIGRTLKDDELTFLLGLDGGEIIETDITQGHVKTLVNTFTNPKDIDWHDDIVLWVEMSRGLSVYNRVTGEQNELMLNNFADCVAYDWLGHKIYCCESFMRMIYRTDINGISHEVIHKSAAIDIAIDAIRGRMYWATKFSIETSYLNGDEHQEIFSLPVFSDRRIISLTVDLETGKVLWFEKGYNSHDLFMADTNHLKNMDHGQVSTLRVKLAEFKNIASLSRIQYFSNHMFWRTEQDSLVIGDSQCNYSSNIGFYPGLMSFTVTHPLMHPYPSNISPSETNVIPNPIQSEDIHIDGVWSNFNLSWPKTMEVTHGTIFYKVFVDVGKDTKSLITSKHFCHMTEVAPYSPLVITIQPYTFWGYAEPTTISLRSPMAIPSAPLSPEIDIIQHKNATVSRQALAADFRWMTPTITNGVIMQHLVTYWMENGSQTVVKVRGTARHFVLTHLEKSKIYNFKVAACTEVGCGPESDIKKVSTNVASPVSTLLVATQKYLSFAENESDHNSTLVLHDTPLKAVTFLALDELRMYWIDTKDKVYEYMGSSIQEIVALNGTGQDLAIDWISRTLYIVVSLHSGESSIMLFNIDVRDYSLLLSRPAHIESILVDPYNSAIIWTELTPDNQGQIIKSDFTGDDIQIMLGNKNSRSRRSSDEKSCSCSQNLNVAPVIAMSYKDDDGATEIVFADKITGSIYSSDISGCQCISIFQPTSSNSFGLPPNLLTVDQMKVSWYNTTEEKLYSINKTSGGGMVIRDIHGLVDIVAYGSHLQPMPDSQCLDPGAYNSSVKIVHVGNTSVSFELAAPIRPPVCQGISSSKYKYTVYYRKVSAGETGATPEDCGDDPSVCDKQNFYSTNVEVTNLEPYTKYSMQIAVSNYYTEYLSEALSDPLFLTTAFGVPGVAREVTVNTLTPELLAVTWLPPFNFNGPTEDLTYVVQFSTTTTKGYIQKELEIMGNEIAEVPITAYPQQLEPDHIYSIMILTCTGNKTRCSATDPVQNKTFKAPSDIIFFNATAHSLEILWKLPPENEILRHQIFHAEVRPGELNWTIANIPYMSSNDTEFREKVTSLLPNTLYAFRIRLAYNGRPFSKAVYVWPSDETRFIYRTMAYLPEQPSPPAVTHLKTGTCDVRWEEPNSNGAPITNYLLEYSMNEGPWQMAYNGSLEQWLMNTSRMEHGMPYVFRIAAVNSEGTGPYSDNSTVFLASLAMETHLNNHVTIGVVAGIIAFLAVIVLAVFCVLQKRCKKSKVQQFIIRGPDTELATLRELPYNTFQQSNTLYAINIQCTDEEIAKLPHFSRKQLVLTIFLGSGAFGEVFEGLAKNIRGDSTGETKCAVKTLRKSASDNEKEEFLKEALLMKNFQHEHILSLLGVCLDNDPQFIIMELMEGGDLLSFLRSCRATSTTPAKLLLPDLVKICLHVARGCKYLEDMHFVHRDLAARNCLVSTKSPSDMIVKIGDFGLARDIYKNDYYRKEGEGLLPVRWMSPESLVDGFFTTQSDIWAFGVLMWEVVTLGQQPYPARTNIEVLHFVRDRGKLERPEKCADELYSLMSKCWSFYPNNRPCFANLVEHIENFQEKCKLMTVAEIAHWSPAFTDGGGSVRLTQSGKQKRLNDLLGSLETPEKLVVDLTKTGRKRTHSLEDAKHALQTSPSSVFANNHFPAAGEYDRNGYLEPRGTKGGGRYLELMNYAPELIHLRDPYGNFLFSGNGSAFLPVHVTHKGYHPSNASYTLLSPEEDTEDSLGQRSTGNSSGSDVCGVEDPRLYPQSLGEQPYRLVSIEESPACSQVQDDLQLHSSRTQGKHFGELYHQSSLSPTMGMMIKPSPQRKFSDQDLYFSTVPYRQHRPSSTTSQEHRYASVECNNNRSSTSNGNFDNNHSDLCDNGGNGLIRNSGRDSGGNFQLYTKPGLGHHLSMNLPAAVEDDSSKISSNRDTWASNLDNVFIDSGMASECSTHLSGDSVNYQGHGHHSSRSRGQVYPESSSPLVGYEINQVSLV